ncbi:MAG: MFS transporter [Rhodospirillaceae bacterium]|nr:MFS transporter [Rhodospirillaceae bacterium]
MSAETTLDRMGDRTGPDQSDTARVSVPVSRIPAYSWYVLTLLTLISLLASFDRSLVSVVMEPIRTEFNLSDPQLGFLAGLAFGLPFALSSLPFGYMIDRLNRRNLIACVVALWSMITAFCGLAQNFTQLLLARMAVGSAEAGFPATQSLISDYFPAKKRPMALGIFMSGGPTAFLLTFALGGWVAQEWGWRAVFWMAGPPGVILSLLFFFTVREPQRGALESNPEAIKEPAPPFLQTLKFLFAQRAFLHLFIGYALIAASNASFWSWIGSLLIRVHGQGLRDAGLYVAVCGGLFGFVGSILGAAAVGRLGMRGMKPVLTFIAIASMMLMPFGIAMSLAPSLNATLVLMVIVGIVKSCTPGPAQGVIISLAKTRMRGVALSLLSLAGTVLGFGVGPFITGSISHFLGGGTAIRYGLASLFLMNLWAGLHFLAARRTVEAELSVVNDKPAHS